MLDIDYLNQWIGRTESMEDIISASKVAALAATLDRDDPYPSNGDPLPVPWHWMLCVPAALQSKLGTDGHPARGGFLPPVPLPRRMWAGGRLTFMQPLRVGETVIRRSQVLSINHKKGRSGDLVFVLVQHSFWGPNGLAITEEHDIVYRDLPSEKAPLPLPISAPIKGLWERTLRPDDVLLFRYSALTFNGHRIHYDRRYVTDIEGYPGLVVHGPLIATLLLDLLRCKLPDRRVSAFEFKATKPLFDTETFSIHCEPQKDGNVVKLWAQDANGVLAMDAVARLCEI